MAAVSDAAAPLLGTSAPRRVSDASRDKQEAQGEAHGAKGFGDKDIGFFSSLCLIVNNQTGPGMVNLPGTFQGAGWLFPTVATILIGLFMGQVSMLLCKAISLIKGNKNLHRRIEFNELFKFLLPRWAYITVMIALLFSFQATNVSAIVTSAQTMDSTLLAIARKSCAIVIYPPERPLCISADNDGIITDSPFGDKYVISIGYLVVMALTIPLGLLNLDSNMWVQIGGFLLLVYCIIAWLYQFAASGLSSANMPAVNSAGFGSVLATIIFNFSFVTTMPSWLNEKGPAVSVSRATWLSCIISGVMFLILGFGGASNLDFSSADLLAVMNGSGISAAAKVAAYIFPSAALLSGIPVVSVIIRYNLLNEGVSLLWANAFAVLFPWIIALFFYSGSLLTQLINWSSALLFVLLNCIAPIAAYIVLKRHGASGGRGIGIPVKPAAPSIEAVAVRTSLAGATAPITTVITRADDAAIGLDEHERRSSGGGSRMASIVDAIDREVAVLGDDAARSGVINADALPPARTRRSSVAETEVDEVSRLLANPAESDVVNGSPDIIEYWHGCQRLVKPLTTAYAMFGVSLVLAIACFALQVYAVSPAGSSASGGN